MRTLIKILWISALIFMISCRGEYDDQALPVLLASLSEIDMEAQEQCRFTVTYDGKDVTEEAAVYCVKSDEELGDAVFIPTTEGIFGFYAIYDGKRSAEVRVKVIGGSEMSESAYNRRVFVAEFTGQWCANCPSGYSAMNQILQGSDRFKNFVHVAAFHSDAEDEDVFAIPQTQDLFRYCKDLGDVTLAYPSFCTDLRYANLLVQGVTTPSFRTSLNDSFKQWPAHCGVAVSTRYDAENANVDVEVRVKSERAMVYRVLVLVVEDKIVGWQSGAVSDAGGSAGDPAYLHRHVVRKVVTSYGDMFSGEKLCDTKVESGQEAVKSWTVDVAPAWNLENTEIYAIAIGDNGYVNNMNVCPIIDGTALYDLKL